MGKDRLLPWKETHPGTCAYANTKLGRVWASSETWRGIDGKDRAQCDGLYANMDAVEDNYCECVGEFVPVAKPGQRIIAETVLTDLVAATEAWMNHTVETLGFDHPANVALRELLTTVEFATESTDYNPTRVLGPNKMAVDKTCYTRLLQQMKRFVKDEINCQVDNPMYGGKPDSKTQTLYDDIDKALILHP